MEIIKYKNNKDGMSGYWVDLSESELTNLPKQTIEEAENGVCVTLQDDKPHGKSPYPFIRKPK